MLDKGILPESWDYDNDYNNEMKGKIYPQDVEGIKTIQRWEMEYAAKRIKK